MEFIHEDFLLHSRTARRLYHEYAEDVEILDYHSHLPAAEVADNRRFRDLTEIWLEGDHYKWRMMRTNGVAERYCTGDAEPYEKFLAWARTVPYTLRNPLYHWTHLELKRFFGINDLLDESTARSVWERGNAALRSEELSAQGILRKFKVRALCTSDDPCDDLRHHDTINKSEPGFRVYPTFRPDNAMGVHQPQSFNAWVDRLGSASGRDISTLQEFLDALKQRHGYFHAHGCRLSDHGLLYCYAAPCAEPDAAEIFRRARAGQTATAKEHEHFASFVMLFLGRLDAEKGWTKQLHVGAIRNMNTRQTEELGPNTGYDSIGDYHQVEAFCKYLDALDRERALPKVVVYSVNPADNYPLATAIGNFQDGSIAGKVQLGSGWWFLDQKEGIEWQLNALSNVGLLSRFIGMLTDSRSFMSFTRHEYFRRVLCNLIGAEMERGDLPQDEKLLGAMIRNICFENARQYLSLELAAASERQKEPVASR